ncbi:hypothetical protein QTP88_029030 [Uroleucon formosanum]
MKAFQMSANSSQKITHFYTNNVVGESSQTFLENPKPDKRDEINEIQNEKLELAELEKRHEITTTEVKVKESNVDFLKYKNQDAEINENSKEVLVETIEIRQEHHQDITGEIVQKLFDNEKIDEVINYFWLKHVTSTSGNSLFETLKDTLAELDLPLKNCVANAFDGAANMSGHYNGVTAKLSEVIANHVHTWCYAHVLNLVLSDTTQCLTPCMSFFNLVQEAFLFFKESYKRLAVYHKENPSLKLAGSVATRWRSRNDAIVKIFGRIEFWIKDYIQAWRHVSSAHKSLQSVRNRFCDITKAAKTFVDFAVKKFDEKDIEIEIEENLPKKRKRTVKRMDGELTRDEEVSTEEIDQFCIKIFNFTMDTIINSLEVRFLAHRILYTDLECFDPQRFDDIRKNGLSSNALFKICELLPSIDQPKLKEELISFATSWPLICKVGLQSTYEDSSQIDTVDDDEWANEDDLKCSKIKECNVCLSCALRIITDYNMYSLQYTELYKAYKYLLTLPLTQVTCERSFSKLKLLKTRLRSTIVQDNLESLFLMQCERDIVNQIDGDQIINALCSQYGPVGTYKVKIAALQEIRWKGAGQVTVKDYEIYFSGMVDRHSFGSGFAVHRSMVPHVKEFRPVSERIAVMRIKSRPVDLILICVHAPTNTSEDYIKDAFYEDLDTTYERLPGNAIKILLGDLNAKCGKEEHFRPIIGSESVHDTSNENELRVISFAASKDMIISSTTFPHKDINKITWKSPDGKTANQIDHVLIQKRFRSCIIDVRSFRGPDCDTDHFLVLGTLRIDLLGHKKLREKRKANINVEAIKDPENQRNFEKKWT